MEIGAHQLPVVPLDPVTQLSGGLRVTLHQIQGEAADVLQRGRELGQIILRSDQGLLADHETPVAGQLFEHGRMAEVVDADHDYVRRELFQCPSDVVEVG
ncbi:hypothetical protein FQZ97_1224100 [compost metagenome]